MPIEITELVIKAQVSAGDPSSSNGTTPADNSQDTTKCKTLETAVKQAVQIIKRKNER